MLFSSLSGCCRVMVARATVVLVIFIVIAIVIVTICLCPAAVE